MKKRIFLLACLSVVFAGCSSSPEKADEAAFANDFPTRDRVDYVMKCVAQHGGLSFINQYACGCKIDKIAEKMTFSEYEAALTFSYLKKTPGEKGAVFRDPEQSKDLRTRFKEVDQYAESQCFVK